MLQDTSSSAPLSAVSSPRPPERSGLPFSITKFVRRLVPLKGGADAKTPPPDIAPLDVGGDPLTTHIIAEHVRYEKSLSDKTDKTDGFDDSVIRSLEAVRHAVTLPPTKHIPITEWFGIVEAVWGTAASNVIHQVYLPPDHTINVLKRYAEYDIVAEQTYVLDPGVIPTNAYYPAHTFPVALDLPMASGLTGPLLRFDVFPAETPRSRTLSHLLQDAMPEPTESPAPNSAASIPSHEASSRRESNASSGMESSNDHRDPKP